MSPQTLGGTYGSLTVAVDDSDAAWQRALDAGAEVFRELEDAVASAILIGAFAGLMPAVRASRMPPTVALRTV